MKSTYMKLAVSAFVGAGLALGAGGSAKAESPKRGGVLEYVVPGKLPSYDGHKESTYALVHRLRPFYSLLIRVNPDNPSSPTDFVCDLCVGDVPKPTEGGTKFTFEIRKGVEFHDGTPLTAHDIVATYQKIIFPPKGIPSARKAFFRSVESVTAPDDFTVVFKLKFPTGSIIPAIATPFNFIYSKKDLEQKDPGVDDKGNKKKAIDPLYGLRWHATNVNGTGAFRFVQHQQGAFVEGKKYEKYHHMGVDGKPKPYLDGFKAINSAKLAVSVAAIRGDRAAAEFRGFPPKHRDDLVKALGDKLTVQESDWNCALFTTPNQKKEMFKDARVRRALNLSLDRWSGSKYLSKIAIVRTVGGIVFPNHPLAATKEELVKLAGYGTDINASRAEAKRLLKEAGVSNLKFTFTNRGVDQPYKIVGTWAIDQWKKTGMTVDQRVLPTPQFYDALRKKKDFDVSIDFNCQSVINPIVDITKLLGSAGNNYGSYTDQALEDIYAKIEKSGDVAEQRKLIREYETFGLSEQSHMGVTLWWYKINPHRAYMKGWKIAPSHYLNQHLDQVWLDK